MVQSTSKSSHWGVPVVAVGLVVAICGSRLAPVSAAASTIRFDPARTYAAAPFSASAVYGSGQIASGDFTGRHRRDLVVSNCDGSGPVVLANRGAGSFAPPRVFRSAPTPARSARPI
jgi:hypothetical protein